MHRAQLARALKIIIAWANRSFKIASANPKPGFPIPTACRAPFSPARPAVTPLPVFLGSFIRRNNFPNHETSLPLRYWLRGKPPFDFLFHCSPLQFSNSTPQPGIKYTVRFPFQHYYSAHHSYLLSLLVIDHAVFHHRLIKAKISHRMDLFGIKDFQHQAIFPHFLHLLPFRESKDCMSRRSQVLLMFGTYASNLRSIGTYFGHRESPYACRMFFLHSTNGLVFGDDGWAVGVWVILSWGLDQRALGIHQKQLSEQVLIACQFYWVSHRQLGVSHCQSTEVTSHGVLTLYFGNWNFVREDQIFYLLTRPQLFFLYFWLRFSSRTCRFRFTPPASENIPCFRFLIPAQLIARESPIFYQFYLFRPKEGAIPSPFHQNGGFMASRPLLCIAT